MTPTTVEKVLAIRQGDPRRKSVRIAETVGVSRQRVDQILNKHGLPTNFWAPDKYCIDCGKRVRRSLRCRPCDDATHWTRTNCLYCGAVNLTRNSVFKARRRYFCDHSHKSLWGWLPGNPLAMRKGRTLKRKPLDTESSDC